MTGSSRNEMISVQYGTVQNVQQIAMAPDYGAGALIGGALGDCVTIEQGRHANIRRVSPVMCSTPPSNPAYQSMNNADLKESSECHEAKQELLKAAMVEQTDIGYKKCGPSARANGVGHTSGVRSGSINRR